MTLRSATSILLCLPALLAAGACGSDEEGAPIPSDSAAALESQLENIKARLANGSVGACNDIIGGDNDPNTTSVNAQIDNLPDDVDGDVVQALRDGFDRLFELVDGRCSELQDEQDQTDTAPLPPPETETTAPPETTPDTTPTEPTTPTTPETPPGNGGTPPGQDGTVTPDQGPDQGNGGQGNGQGNGGQGNGQGNGGGALVPGTDG